MPAAASLRPYAPEVLLHLLQQHRTHMHTHAAALFADIAGFTAMTECKRAMVGLPSASKLA